MRKQTIIKIFAIILCVALLLTCLVACKPKEVPKTPEEIAAEARETARNELGEALGNSIDAKLQDGFNLDLSGKLDFQDVNNAWAYGFKIQGNVLAAPKESGKANNDFTIEITKGEDVIFGLYNKGNDMYVSVDTPDGELKYSFSDAPLFESLRYVLAQNLGDSFTGLPSLGNIAVEGSTIGQLVKDFVPLLISQMDTFDSIAKEGNKITVDLDLHKLMELILPLIGDLGADFEIDLPETAIVGLSVEITNKTITDIKAEVYLSDVNNTTTVNFEMKSGNNGIFGAIREDYAISADIYNKFKSVPKTSLIQTEINGTINLMSKGEVVKVLDWSLKAKLDVVKMMAKNFDLSDPFFAENNNFFHFQITHTCGKHNDCGTYCDYNVFNGTYTDNMEGDFYQGVKTRTSYRNGSIVDILWGPQSMGSSNITVDVNLFDLIGGYEFTSIIAGLAGLELPPNTGNSQDLSLGVIVGRMLSGHFATSIDVNSLLVSEDLKGGYVKDAAANVADLDLGGIMGILTQLLGTVTIGDGVSLDLNALGEVLASALGVGEILPGLGIPELLGVVFGMNTDAINIAGADGIGSYVGFEYGKQSLDTYNVYDKYSKLMNGLPGTKFDIDANGYSQYDGQNLMTGVTKGMPLLYIVKDSINVDANKNMVLYTSKLGDDDMTTEYTPLDKAPSTYEFEHIYNMGKSLYVQYKYIGLDKQEYTHYLALNCINGLDINKSGSQAVTIGTGLLMAKGFDYLLNSNVIPLVGALGMAIPAIDIASLLPVNSQSFKGNILIDTKSTVSDVVATPNCGLNIKATTDIKGLKANVSYKINGVSHSIALDGDISDLPRDINGQVVAGKYTVNYFVPILDEKVSAEITVEAAKEILYVPSKLDQSVAFGSKVADIDYGTVNYSYDDGKNTAKIKVKDLIARGLATVTANKNVTDGIFTDSGLTNVTVNFNNQEQIFNITVKDQVPDSYEVIFMFKYEYLGTEQFSYIKTATAKGTSARIDQLQPSLAAIGLPTDGSVTVKWYLDKECTKAVPFYVNADMIVYGKATKTVKVTWNVQFPNATDFTYTQTIEEGKTPTAYPTLKTTAMNNKYIAGWTSYAGGTSVVDVLNKKVNGSTTYHAIIKDTPSITYKTGLDNTLTKTVQLNFGQISTASAPVKDGNGAYGLTIPKALLDEHQNNPAGGYAFTEWFTDAAHTTKFVATGINANTTIYAGYNLLEATYEYTGLFEGANISQGNINLTYGEINVVKGVIKVVDGKIVLEVNKIKYELVFEVVGGTYADAAIDNTTGAITWGKTSNDVKGIELKVSIMYNGNKVTEADNIIINAPAVVTPEA